jgi:hypothetical protein
MKGSRLISDPGFSGAPFVNKLEVLQERAPNKGVVGMPAGNEVFVPAAHAAEGLPIIDRKVQSHGQAAVDAARRGAGVD